MYGRAIARQRIHSRPVFILGHPRTGTTMLHNLLARDTSQFAYCSSFAAGFPSACLWFERFKPLLAGAPPAPILAPPSRPARARVRPAGVVDSRRPMDNMPLSLDTPQARGPRRDCVEIAPTEPRAPQEDEIAVNVLTAGTSPYMPLVFMNDHKSFAPYFSFRDAPRRARHRWVGAFLHFLRKLSLRAAGKRLLLKSPVHTSRVELLLALFPNAQFIYIHRDPREVFASACHMAETTYPYMYLCDTDPAQLQEFILSQFETLWDDYARDRPPRPVRRSRHSRSAARLLR